MLKLLVDIPDTGDDGIVIDLNWEINAISPYLDNGLQEKGIETAEEVSNLLNINTSLSKTDINYSFDFVGEDYGILTQGAKDAIKLLQAKNRYFLIRYIRQNAWMVC